MALSREVARRTVRMGSLLAAAACGGFAVLYAIGGPAEFVIPNILASAALALLALFPLRSTEAQLAAIVATSTALLTVQLLLTGQLHGGIAVWFLIPTLGAMLVGARRVAAWCSAVSVLVVYFIVGARRLDLPIVGHVVLPNPDLVLATSILACIIVMGGMAVISLRARLQLMADLEGRNEELAVALDEAEEARVAAQDAAEAKDRFFANLTHEIRTPLNGIAGTAELMHAASLPDEERAMADALVASTRALVTLVNSMLAHARLRAGNVDIERGPVDVRGVAGDLEALFRTPAADKGLALAVTVDADVPPWIETDGAKLRQVVGNLVGNAVKFTERGAVGVTFAVPMPADAPGDRQLVVTVTDTGGGIAPELADVIFEPFVQGDSSMTRAHGGTGLGLTIASQLAAVLGGSLVVASAPGDGSVFTLEIPFVVAAPPVVDEPVVDEPVVEEPVATPATARPRVRVLLAEDNEINRAVGSRMLGRLGADVVLARDGTEAVQRTREGGIGLILMDLQMPGMDGISAAREIRKWEAETGAAPSRILAMTGNAPEDYGDACAAAGMDGFITKPVEMAQLRVLFDQVAAAAACRELPDDAGPAPAAGSNPPR